MFSNGRSTWMKNTFRKVSSVQLQYCTVDTSIIFHVYTNLHTNFKGLYPFLKQLEREELESPGQSGKSLWRKGGERLQRRLESSRGIPAGLCPSLPSFSVSLLKSPFFSGSHEKCSIFFPVHRMGSWARTA